MAAVDELALGTMPDPNTPGSDLIYVQNNSTSHSIRDSFRLNGDKDFEVYHLKGNKKHFMPLEFEMRIPAGLRAFLGPSKFRRHLDYHGHIEMINISADMVGGVYVSDEPLPLPAPDDAYSYTFKYYDIANVGYFVNINSIYGMKFRVVHTNPPHSGTTSALDPFAQKALEVGYQGAPYDLYDVSFYTTPMLSLAAKPSHKS